MSAIDLLVTLAAQGTAALTAPLTVISGGDMLSVAGAAPATDKEGNTVVGLTLATYAPPIPPPPPAPAVAAANPAISRHKA